MPNENDADKRMAALMERVIKDLGSVKENDSRAPYHAMVRIWHNLRNDQPLHDLATKIARNNSKTGKEVRGKVAEVLSHGKAIRQRLASMNGSHPRHICAFLQGIEDYLKERYGSPSLAAPPPSVHFDGQQYWVFRRPHERATSAPLAQQNDKLEHWLVRHWIAPAEINGIRIERMDPARGDLGNRLTLIRKSGNCKVFVVSFTDGVEPEWTKPEVLVATGLTDEDKRWKSVEAALEKAVQKEAHIVIFPELTLPDTLRIRLCQWLVDERPDHPFLLVLAGSFHVKRDDGVYNEAQLLDRDGCLALSHTKLTPYEKSDRVESIELKYQLNVLDTPLGSFVIPICKDFCDLGSHMEEVWKYVVADWFLVPAFGDASSIDAHKDRARELWIRSNSFSVVANQHPEGISEQDVHGFIVGGAIKDNNPVRPGDKDSNLVHACCPTDGNSNIAYACKAMPLEKAPNDFTSDFPAHETLH